MTAKFDKEIRLFLIIGIVSIFGALITVSLFSQLSGVMTLSGFLFGLGMSYLTLSFTMHRNKQDLQKLEDIDNRLNEVSDNVKKILTTFNIPTRKYYNDCLGNSKSE